MAKAERIAVKQKEEERTMLCSLYDDGGYCGISSKLAKLIIEYRVKGRSKLNHGITEALPYAAFTQIDQARHACVEFCGMKDRDGFPVMICRGHARWPHGFAKVKSVQQDCWLPELSEKLK